MLRKRMSRIAIQLLMLATYATALVVVPVVTPAKASMSNGRHLKKHKKPKRPGFSGAALSGGVADRVGDVALVRPQNRCRRRSA